MKATIADLAQLIALRRDVRLELGRCDVGEEDREAILLAMTELGTNLIRHGYGGVLEVTMPTAETPHVVVRSTNPIAPSSPEVRTGSRDQRPVTGPSGLGIGLDSLHRIMDRVAVSSEGDAFRVVAEKDLSDGETGRD